MAMAKVFTGWSWAFPDNQLTEQNFRWGSPDYSAANDQRIDLLKMKAYPGQHSQAEKRLFTGKPSAVVIPANSSGARQPAHGAGRLVQAPQRGPVHRPAADPAAGDQPPQPGLRGARGQRVQQQRQRRAGRPGRRGARHPAGREARNPPAGSIGKLREPVLRVAHWMRSFAATSASGQFMMAYELDAQVQRAMYAPSVFGYFRPGYVPPNTAFSPNRITVPELQIVNEATTADWVNTALAMAGSGLGWTGGTQT